MSDEKDQNESRAYRVLLLDKRELYYGGDIIYVNIDLVKLIGLKTCLYDSQVRKNILECRKNQHLTER